MADDSNDGSVGYMDSLMLCEYATLHIESIDYVAMGHYRTSAPPCSHSKAFRGKHHLV